MYTDILNLLITGRLSVYILFTIRSFAFPSAPLRFNKLFGLNRRAGTESGAGRIYGLPPAAQKQSAGPEHQADRGWLRDDAD
jgi:hypothetical protein